jgi:hypothetical protein
MIEVDGDGVASVVGPGNDGTKPMAIRAAERRLSELNWLIKQAEAAYQLHALYAEEFGEIREFIAFYNTQGEVAN